MDINDKYIYRSEGTLEKLLKEIEFKLSLVFHKINFT